MINGNLDNFLDTGWFSEATLFYNDHVYWCEGFTDPESRLSTFFVDRWAARADDKGLYHELRSAGELVDYSRVLEIQSSSGIESMKKSFLSAPIFDRYTFWDIESSIAWLDEGSPIDV